MTRDDTAQVLEPRCGYNGAPPLASLVAADGTTWLEYRKTLTPDHARAWRDMLFSYAMLLAGYAAQLLVHSRARTLTQLLLVPLLALWMGFWLHALNQFAHEGSHGHLLPNRKWNDWLTDWFLWPLFAQSVQSYRKSHMQHHVHLGDHLDTEINYHECMSPWFFIKTLTGIQLLLMLVRYLVRPRTLTIAGASGQKAFATRRERLLALSRSALVHGAFIGVPLLFGRYGAALAWFLAVAAVYPCLGTARQILEHRAYPARCETDFTRVEHGATNRLFGDGVFSRWFGAAGVNRHLLHHWDPTVSYTRLPDMEQFVLRTPCAPLLEQGRTTYAHAARTLLRTALG